MAVLKEVLFLSLVLVFLQIMSISCHTLEKARKLDSVKDFARKEALLRSLMKRSSSQAQGHSRVRRGAYKDWTDHPLFPLYEIDYPACQDAPREAKYGLCKSWAKDGYCKKYKRIMKTYCRKECQMCKAPAPPACQSSRYGCCWDNSIATGPDGEGCHPCFDVYRHSCRQFDDYCVKEGRNGRFIRYHCFKTCGRCALMQPSRKH